MARKRMIDPHFWESAQIKGWTSDDCTVMMAAISAADDEGRGRIKSITDNISGIISTRKFKKSCQNLSDSIIFYSKLFYFLPNWQNYQTVSHPTKSKFPKPNPSNYNNLDTNPSGINPELIRNDSITVKFSLKEDSLKEVKVNDSNDQPFNSQPLNVDFNLPLLTEVNDYAPEDYKNRDQVTHSIRNLLTQFIGLQNPETRIVTSFVNVVMNTKQVKNQTAFRYLFEDFSEFHTLPEEKRNLGYLYTRVKGRIDDALIKGREEKSKMSKQSEKKEITSDVSKDISQLANKMRVN